MGTVVVGCAEANEAVELTPGTNVIKNGQLVPGSVRRRDESCIKVCYRRGRHQFQGSKPQGVPEGHYCAFLRKIAQAVVPRELV